VLGFLRRFRSLLLFQSGFAILWYWVLLLPLKDGVLGFLCRFRSLLLFQSGFAILWYWVLLLPLKDGVLGFLYRFRSCLLFQSGFGFPLHFSLHGLFCWTYLGLRLTAILSEVSKLSTLSILIMK